MQNFNGQLLYEANMCHRAKFHQIGQTVAEISRFDCFLNGSRPPSWISIVHMWTTHDEYLVVSIVVQNLAGIDAVVLIICDFQYLARYRLEMPIFYSPKMGFMW